MKSAMSRRDFLAVTGSAAGAMAVAGRAWALPAPRLRADTFFEWKTINERVRVAIGQGGNATVVADGGEVVIIDTKNSPFGDVLRREGTGSGTLKMVINTHHHADHTGGNHAFVKAVPVLAQEKALPRVASQVNRYIGQIKQAGLELDKAEDKIKALILEDYKRLDGRKGELKPEDFKPTESFGADKEVKVGGTELVLRHIGPGHTDNDAFIFVEGANVMVTGDLVFHRMHPFIDRESGATTVGWRESCRKMLELCDAKTVVVPGHGEITDREGIQLQITYFDEVCAQIERLVKDGRKREDARSFVSPRFSAYGREQGRASAFGAIFDELSEKK